MKKGDNEPNEPKVVTSGERRIKEMGFSARSGMLNKTEGGFIWTADGCVAKSNTITDHAEQGDSIIPLSIEEMIADAQNWKDDGVNVKIDIKLNGGENGSHEDKKSD